jgi:hypothetical protein
MSLLSIPTTADLVTHPQLASLVLLELALALTAASLCAALPLIEDDYRAGEAGEITTARVLLHECDQLREDLDQHRRLLRARLQRQQSDWPF